MRDDPKSTFQGSGNPTPVSRRIRFGSRQALSPSVPDSASPFAAVMQRRPLPQFAFS